LNETELEIVHSPANGSASSSPTSRWARAFGIYTDMNAIRADEELDNIHSLYVDQWGLGDGDVRGDRTSIS
jgi:aspartate--ammonia ligase